MGCRQISPGGQQPGHHGHLIGGHENFALPDGQIQGKPLRRPGAVSGPVIFQGGHFPPAGFWKKKGSLAKRLLKSLHDFQGFFKTQAIRQGVKIHVAGLCHGVHRRQPSVAGGVPALPGSGAEGIGTVAERKLFFRCHNPPGEGQEQKQGLIGGARGIQPLERAVQKRSVRTGKKGLPVSAPCPSQQALRIKGR